MGQLRSSPLLVLFSNNVIVTIVVICVSFIRLTSCTSSENLYMHQYAVELISEYGSAGSLSVHQLQTLLSVLRSRQHPRKEVPIRVETNTCDDNETIISGEQMSLACLKYNMHNKCLTAEDIFLIHGLEKNKSVDISRFGNILPTVLFEAQKSRCMNNITHNTTAGAAPTALEVWGYSFLFVTGINLCSLIGFGFMPFMKKKFYHTLLMFFVALAVGTLAGSALLFLIPDAFGLLEIEEEYHQKGISYTSFVMRATVVLGGIYLFFLTERIMKIVMDYRESMEGQDVAGLNNLPICSVRTHTDVEIDPMKKVPPNIGKQTCTMPRTDSANDTLEKYGRMEEDEGTVNLILPKAVYSGEGDEVKDLNGGVPEVRTESPDSMKHQKVEKPKQKIAPVAWMIIFGDALHNFIDGLSIGAAFSTSLMAGVSVSVAVLCEEFPHELGDFAILLNSGMTVKQALGYNFISACSCYIGLVIGIVLGELTSASKWIFALAGGMFLYISLADMMPEINHAAESKETKQFNMSHTQVFIVQNLGLLIGFGAMFLLALYGGNIDFQ